MDRSAEPSPLSAPLSHDTRSATSAGATPRPDCDVEALASTLSHTSNLANLRRMLSAVARKRYGLRAVDAEDVFQDAVVTYLEVRDRYPRDANHFGLFVGICRRTALTSLTRARRRTRRLERFSVRLADERRIGDPKDRPDGAALRAERDAAIRAALASLSKDARELLVGLAEGAQSRVRVIAELGVNPNTFDSRVHKARKALRLRLARSGGY